MRLGRLPRVPDERDFRLENFLGLGASAASADPATLIEEARAAFAATTVTYARWARTSYPDVRLTQWWKGFDFIAQAKIALGVVPPPAPSGDVLWSDPETVLDQGNFGTCVGNGSAQWGNTLPIDDKFTEKDARAIYYEATILDGSPDDPDAPGGGQQGATVKSGVRALQNRKRLSAYAESGDLSVCESWLKSKGSIIVGSDWENDMFQPDPQGFVMPTGGYAGGHCYLWDEITAAGDYGFLNSWGSSWGLKGRFYMKKADFSKLIANGGECWTAVELPL